MTLYTDPEESFYPEEGGAEAPPSPAISDLDQDPVDLAVEAYNAGAAKHGWTQYTVVTEERRGQLGARLEAIGGLQAFMVALSAIPADDYLMGRKEAAAGRRRFRLTLDYLLRTGAATGDVLAGLLDAASDADARSAAAPPLPTAPAPLDEPTRRVHARLRARYGEEVYGSWFQHLHLESLEGGTVRTSLPTKFHQTWIQAHYADSLLECCKAEFAGAERLDIVVREGP